MHPVEHFFHITIVHVADMWGCIIEKDYLLFLVAIMLLSACKNCSRRYKFQNRRCRRLSLSRQIHETGAVAHHKTAADAHRARSCESAGFPPPPAAQPRHSPLGRTAIRAAGFFGITCRSRGAGLSHLISVPFITSLGRNRLYILPPAFRRLRHHAAEFNGVRSSRYRLLEEDLCSLSAATTRGRQPQPSKQIKGLLGKI